MIYIGKRELEDAYLGTKKVLRMYLGDVLEYSSERIITFNPEFSVVSKKYITMEGTEAAGSSRSHTSPIQVLKNDIVKVTCATYNSAAAATIAETDVNETFYTPIFDGTGGEGGSGRNDPRTWTYVPDKDTYIVCSYLTNIGITVTITRTVYGETDGSKPNS